MSSAQRFSGYPAAREGPDIAYTTQSEDSNPVLRGWALVIAANIITRSSMVANATWTNSKFGVIKDIPELRDYDWRLNHTVTPLAAPGEVLAKPEITPELYERQPSDIPGRFYSAADYHELYKSGALTPLQVAKALLPLINPDPTSKGKYASAWSVTREETVLTAAKASTERYATGKNLGILDGVPVGVKDDIDVEGYISHFGLPIDPSDSSVKPATRTIWPIAQLEAAGAIVVGKAAMHELGLDTSGCNPRRGSPKNWYNTSYYTGGSSSGPASALCAGLVPIAVGTDGGGSIRIPASFCGMFGLKPTLHRVFTMKSAITVIGPMAATAADLAIAYRIMSAPNPEDTIQGAFAPSIPPSPTAKKTIGIYREWIDRSNPLVLDATNKAVAYFSDKLGYEVVDIKIPYLREGQWAHSAWALSEGLDHLRSGVSTPSKYLSKVNHATQVLITIGSCVSALDMIKYGQLRGLLMEHLAFLFKRHPGMLIVTPTTPDPGWKVHPGDEAYGFSDGNFTIRNMMYIWLANSTGCPAVSAPIGFVDPEQGEGKLPVGLMAMGEWGAEEQLLAWAREAEGYVNDCLDGGRVRPKEWADVVELAQAVDAGDD